MGYAWNYVRRDPGTTGDHPFIVDCGLCDILILFLNLSVYCLGSSTCHIQLLHSTEFDIEEDPIDLIRNNNTTKDTGGMYIQKRKERKNKRHNLTGAMLELSCRDISPQRGSQPIFYSFALAPSSSSAPAPLIAGLPVSTTVAWKRTVLPSFHISVLRV